MRVRLERDHGERGPRPQPLPDRVGALADEARAGLHRGRGPELLLAERQRADAAQLALAGRRHVAVEPGHVERAVLLLEAGHEPRQDAHGVGRRPAEEAAVDRLLEAAHLDVHLADAAQLVGERGMADVEVAGVGEHRHVGGELPPVAREEGLEPGRADLLLALDQDLDVRGRRRARLEPGRERRHVRDEGALVVDGARGRRAGPSRSVGSKAGSTQRSGRPGRLHVVVPVHEQRGRSLGVQPVRVHVGVARGSRSGARSRAPPRAAGRRWRRPSGAPRAAGKPSADTLGMRTSSARRSSVSPRCGLGVIERGQKRRA